MRKLIVLFSILVIAVLAISACGPAGDTGTGGTPGAEGDPGLGGTPGAEGMPGTGGTPGAEVGAADGAEVFSANCAGCHGEQGEGGAGGPALTGNELATSEDPQALIDFLVNGRDGAHAFGTQLTSDQIAAVATYVRTSWGNQASPVDPAQVP